MNVISRPEYYVVPTSHPGNCRCSQHRSKRGKQVTATPVMRQAGHEGATTLAQWAAMPGAARR